MIEEKIDIVNHWEIKFPNAEHFAESFYNDSANGKIYFPLNVDISSKIEHGVYEYNYKNLDDENLDDENNKLKLLFQPLNNDIILGCKISNNKFIGCVTNINSIIIYDLGTKKIEYIKVEGCPNDLCIDKAYPNIIYVVINMDYMGYNGIVKKINIDTKESEILIGNLDSAINKYKLYSVTGINIINSHIYISTLLNVIRINLSDNKIEICIENNELCPFYDNISLNEKNENELCISIFDYDQQFAYRILINKILNNILQCLFSFFFGVGYYNIYNNNRKMNNSKKIKFINYNVTNKSYKLITLDPNVNDFDYVITQIEKISDNRYLLVNWKANRFIIISTSVASNNCIISELHV